MGPRVGVLERNPMLLRKLALILWMTKVVGLLSGKFLMTLRPSGVTWCQHLRDSGAPFPYLTV